MDKLTTAFTNDLTQLNTDVIEVFGKSQAHVIWSEGGEWPAYNPDYKWNGDVENRDVTEVAYVAYTTVKQSMANIKERFHTGESFVGVAMDCGTGKSTALVKELHAHKYGVRTLVIEPSMTVARQLAEYLNDESIAFVRNASELRDGRLISYLSAGSFLDVAFRGGIKSTDLIVVDESHCVTPTYEIMRDILNRIDNRVIFLTASTSSELKTLRGVRMQLVEGMTPQVADSFASDPKGIIVGVQDNLTYANSANMLVGVTIPIKLLYETGLRPDPCVVKGQLSAGERLATKGEIIQMIGRLGRLKDSGIAYVCKDPKALQLQGPALYSIILNSIRSAMKLGGSLSIEKGVKGWKCSGLVGRTVGLSASGSAAREVTPEQVTSDAEKSVKFDDSNAITSEEDTPKKAVMINYGFKRRSSSSSSSSIQMNSGVIDKATGREIQGVKPQSGWRPFNKYGDVSSKSSSGDLLSMLNQIGHCLDAGDTLFPARFPLADPTQVSVIVKDEARMALAGMMLPSYSEMEALAVTILWNDNVASLGHRPMNKRVALQFTEYFRGYSNYVGW